MKICRSSEFMKVEKRNSFFLSFTGILSFMPESPMVPFLPKHFLDMPMGWIALPHFKKTKQRRIGLEALLFSEYYLHFSAPFSWCFPFWRALPLPAAPRPPPPYSLEWSGCLSCHCPRTALPCSHPSHSQPSSSVASSHCRPLPLPGSTGHFISTATYALRSATALVFHTCTGLQVSQSTFISFTVSGSLLTWILSLCSQPSNLCLELEHKPPVNNCPMWNAHSCLVSICNVTRPDLADQHSWLPQPPPVQPSSHLLRPETLNLTLVPFKPNVQFFSKID